ncbi:MAG TPA: CHASE3 domain-containing protein [Candidatus Angelobacter sp.]|nr:CHASE3 domain-containing protein [Candidatus Angelobacter sp.]
MRINILAAIAFILILGFWGTLAWNSFSRTHELQSSQAYAEHTNQVLYELDGVQNALGDAREAWLHYILTPEREDLEAFDDSTRQIWKGLADMEALTHDDPATRDEIKQLEGSIAEELQQLRDNLRTTKTLLIYHTPATDARQNHVRNTMQKLRAEQEELLRERNLATQSRTEEMERSVSILVSVFNLLIAALFLLVILESKKLLISKQTTLNAQARGAHS